MTSPALARRAACGRWRVPAAFAFLVALHASARAVADDAPERRVTVADRPALERALSSARPGTTILIAPGDYDGGLFLSGLEGEEGAPITIASRDPDAPARFRGGGSAFHLVSPRHVVLRGLVVEGASANGINIDDGGSTETPARDVVLSGLVVRDVGPRGNRDGIKMSGVTGFRVEGCTVERWGDGGSGIDLVGCRDGVIERCVFRHEEPASANGVQLKGGTRDVIVRRSRFRGAGARGVNIGGSTGLAYFRPRPEGFEAKDITVEDCVFEGSSAPIAFVGVDGAIVRHNLIWRPRRWALRILQETREEGFVPSRRGRFERNVVAWRGGELRSLVNVGGGTAPETFVFAENAWCDLDEPERTRELVRRGLPTGESGGRYGFDPKLIEPLEEVATGAAVVALRARAREALGGAGPRAAAEDAAAER